VARVAWVERATRREAQVSWNEETEVVMAPRAEILSRSADELLERRILPRYEPSEAWLAYIAHHVASKNWHGPSSVTRGSSRGEPRPAGEPVRQPGRSALGAEGCRS